MNLDESIERYILDLRNSIQQNKKNQIKNRNFDMSKSKISFNNNSYLDHKFDERS